MLFTVVRVVRRGPRVERGGELLALGYRIHLPVGADKAVVDTANMGWVDHTAGWEPKTTTNADGTQTTVVYRHLTATSSSPTRCLPCRPRRTVRCRWRWSPRSDG